MAENSPKGPECAKRENEAAMAEAEARIAKAKKDIAEHEKDETAAKDRDLQSANRDKAIAEAKKAAAEADKASIEAQVPTSATKALEGKVELDDKAGYFADLLAYRCLKTAAKDLVKSVSAKLQKENTIGLVTKLDWQQAATQFTEVSSRLQNFDEIFDNLNKYDVKSDSVTVATREMASVVTLAAAPAVLGAIADVAALFREDRTIKGRVISLNQIALVAEVASQLLDKVAAVFLPSLCMAEKSDIVEKFTTTRNKDTAARVKRSAIERTINTLCEEIEKLEEQLKTEQDKTRVQERLAKARDEKSTADVAKGHFDAVISAFAEFAMKLSSIPDGATVSPLATLSEVSFLRNKQLLYVCVVSQGGEFEARRSIWTGGSVYHRGGIVCAYILFHPTGQIISSGTVESELHAKDGTVERVCH